MLTSFGEEISQTPLQLAALMSAVANGGTLYYLQYPRTPLEDCKFVPRIKRQLLINSVIPEITPGLLGAVEFGTARRARQEQPIAGKTGTCTEAHTHLGWFGSFSDVGGRRLAVVVLLLGGRSANSAQASAIAGNIYHELQKSSPVFVSAERQRSRRLRDPPGYKSGCESTEGMSDRKFGWSLSRVGSLFVLGIVAAVLGVWFFQLTKCVNE